MIVKSLTHPQFNGELTTICSELVERKGKNGKLVMAHEILLPGPDTPYFATPPTLRHRYDGDEPGVEGAVDDIWIPNKNPALCYIKRSQAQAYAVSRNLKYARDKLARGL